MGSHRFRSVADVAGVLRSKKGTKINQGDDFHCLTCGPAGLSRADRCHRPVQKSPGAGGKLGACVAAVPSAGALRLPRCAGVTAFALVLSGVQQAGLPHGARPRGIWPARPFRSAYRPGHGLWWARSRMRLRLLQQGSSRDAPSQLMSRMVAAGPLDAGSAQCFRSWPAPLHPICPARPQNGAWPFGFVGRGPCRENGRGFKAAWWPDRRRCYWPGSISSRAPRSFDLEAIVAQARRSCAGCGDQAAVAAPPDRFEDLAADAVIWRRSAQSRRSWHSTVSRAGVPGRL